MTAAAVCVHRFGPERRYVARSGRMEGEWLVRSCERCNTFSLRSVEAPGDSLAALLDHLRDLGCDPQPVVGPEVEL